MAFETKIIETRLGLSVEDASPAKLGELLQIFDAKLAEVGVDIDAILNPGIEADEIHTAMDAIGLVAPDELLMWFGWHNGIRETPDRKFVGVPPFAFPSTLAWSIDNYRYHIAEGVPLGVWAEGWLQLESDRGISIFCSGVASEPPLVRREAVEEYDFLEESTRHQVVSLCTVVSWWLEALDAEAAHPTYDPGRLEWIYDGVQLMTIDRGTCILA